MNGVFMRESYPVSHLIYWFHKIFFPLKETKEMERATSCSVMVAKNYVAPFNATVRS